MFLLLFLEFLEGHQCILAYFAHIFFAHTSTYKFETWVNSSLTLLGAIDNLPVALPHR